MKEYYLDKLKYLIKDEKGIYIEASEALLGKVLSYKELEGLDSSDLMNLFLIIKRTAKFEKSPYDLHKLARAIQGSRSGAGGCSMTPYICAFCGNNEIWDNTAIPKLCYKCAEKMASNIIQYGYDLNKTD